MIATSLLGTLTFICFVGVLYDYYHRLVIKFQVKQYKKMIDQKALSTPLNFDREPNINKYIRNFTSAIEARIKRVVHNNGYRKYIPYKITVEYRYHSVQLNIHSRSGEREDIDNFYLFTYSNDLGAKVDVYTSSEEFPVMLQAVHKLNLEKILYENS